MSVKIKVELKPLNVPNFVMYLKERGNGTGIPISELDADTINQLCNQYRAAMFRKAGIEDKAGK